MDMHIIYWLARVWSLNFWRTIFTGCTKDFTKHTLVAEYNNIKSVEKIFNKYKNKIAAIIMEPVPANMGLIYPKKDF